MFAVLKHSARGAVGHSQEKCSGAREVMRFMLPAAAVAFGANRGINKTWRWIQFD